MDLLGSLNDSKWKTSKPEDQTEWRSYLVLKSFTTKDSAKYEYIIQEDSPEAVMRRGILEGTAPKTNPLQFVRKIDFQLKPTENGDFVIVAMNLDGDCVSRK